MDKYIAIDSIGSISALGCNEKDILQSLIDKKCHFQIKNGYPIIPIHPNAELELNEFLKQYPKYKKIDRTAQLGIITASACLSKLNKASKEEWVINAGSSRGATGIWENYHNEFIKTKSVPVKSSPLTTLGNISTHIAQHHKLNGFRIDHSITCSSGLQALANAFAWLRSGLCNHFLAIGTEAPLTDFTIAQMAALGIYSQQEDEYPCKPCFDNASRTNTFVLGEGAVAIALSVTEKPASNMVYLVGLGTASETISSPTAISPNGNAFQLSMEKALQMSGLKPSDINVIIPHSPGTYQGDLAECKSIETIFHSNQHNVINHKFLTGHTLGASGLLSIELGYYFLTKNLMLNFPYHSLYPPMLDIVPQTVLVNSMGFGGNAVSIILKRF